MPDVTIKKKDETQIQLVSNDSGILREISDHFTFFVDGYKFTPAYRNKSWDGRIRLLNLRNNTMAYGLLAEVADLCKSRGYSIALDKEITSIYSPSRKEIEEFIESVPLSSRGQKISLRDYQIDGVVNAIQNQRCLTISPTASGKSALIYMIIRWYLENGPDKNIILVVPSTALVLQMKKDFIDYSEFDDSFDGEKEVHEIYSGKEKFNYTSRVTVTTWQTAHRMPSSWFHQFGMVIGDEAHNFKASSLNEIMSKLIYASYRIGTTGTIDNIACNKLVLIGNFGPTHRVTTTKKLMDNNTLAKLNISCLVLQYSDELRKVVSKAKYQDEIDYIVSHQGRNRFIRNLALSQTGNTLVLFNYVEKHGKPLFKLIKEKADPSRHVFYISGEIATEDREEIRTIADKEKSSIIVASFGCFSVGINLRNINSIIFAAPSKSQIRVLQSIGRGLRKADDGRNTVLYDISDDFSWKTKKNYTLRHAIERIKIYNSEQFEYKQFSIQIQ